MDFRAKLDRIAERNNSLVCVGLDSDLDRIPEHIKKNENPQFIFNKAIIEATHDLVCAYKPNIAFYEAEGSVGLEQLKLTMDYLKSEYPEIPVILDAKRADIGNTNKGYVRYVFDYFCADAVTLHPYLGKESLTPFLERKNKGIFILCRTSNPGAGEFQDLLLKKSQPAEASVKKDTHLDQLRGRGSITSLYQVVAENVTKHWNCHGNCGLVISATYPAELEIVRHIAGSLPFLIPGIGTQGGDVEKTVKAGVDSNGKNAIINSSRSIIFAGGNENFAEKSRSKAKRLRDLINQYRQAG